MNSTKGIYVSNIQRMSLHDGTGIRTTIFLKGCPLHCPWCANPETQKFGNQYWYDKERCIGNETSCFVQSGMNCNICKKMIGDEVKCDDTSHQCYVEALKPIATVYSENELYNELIKDVPFWMKDGGVTFSGGEVLSQINQLERLLKKLKDDKINICFETAFFGKEQDVRTLIRYSDFVYVDMKIINREKCKEIIGGEIDNYLRNLKILDVSNKPYIIRIPLVKGYTYTNDNLNDLLNTICQLREPNVEILSGHHLGKKKYEMCNKKYEDFEELTEEELQSVHELFVNTGINVKVLRV